MTFDPSKFPRIPLRKTLIVVDAQNEFLSEDGALPVNDYNNLILKISLLASRFRIIGDVIWVRTEFTKPRAANPSHVLVDDSSPEAFLSPCLNLETPHLLKPGSHGAQMPAALVDSFEENVDTVITKSQYSSFQDTNLVRRLRQHIATELYMCGSLVNVGVLATAIDATPHGGTVSVITDCCGYRDEKKRDLAFQRLDEVYACRMMESKELLSQPKSSGAGARNMVGPPRQRVHRTIGRRKSEAEGSHEKKKENIEAKNEVSSPSKGKKKAGIMDMRDLSLNSPVSQTKAVGTVDTVVYEQKTIVADSDPEGQPEVKQENQSALKVDGSEAAMAPKNANISTKATPDLKFPVSLEEQTAKPPSELTPELMTLPLSKPEPVNISPKHSVAMPEPSLSPSPKVHSPAPAKKPITPKTLSNPTTPTTICSDKPKALPLLDRPSAIIDGFFIGADDDSASDGEELIASVHSRSSSISRNSAKLIPGYFYKEFHHGADKEKVAKYIHGSFEGDSYGPEKIKEHNTNAGEQNEGDKKDVENKTQVESKPETEITEQGKNAKKSTTFQTNKSDKKLPKTSSKTPLSTPLQESTQSSPKSPTTSSLSSIPKFLCEGDTTLHTSVIPPALATSFFTALLTEIPWTAMYHRTGAVPRLLAVQGTVASDGSYPIYRHPADSLPPLTHFTPTVLKIKEIVERSVGHPVNNVLIQRYRNGLDHITEHADKTLDIARTSYIANVSLGSQRTMYFRTKRTSDGPRKTQSTPLPHGSLLRMGLYTNKHWLHSIRPDKRAARDKTAETLAFNGERISLTFRLIATFVSGDRLRIWGQGARGKTRETAGQVVSGRDEAREILVGFGRENHEAIYIWEEVYGRGFNVIDMGIIGKVSDGDDKKEKSNDSKCVKEEMTARRNRKIRSPSRSQRLSRKEIDASSEAKKSDLQPNSPPPAEEAPSKTQLVEILVDPQSLNPAPAPASGPGPKVIEQKQ